MLKISNKLKMLILVILPNVFCIGQKQVYFQLDINPSSSWSNDDGSTTRFTNPIGGSIGYFISKRLSIETGIIFNRTGYRYERIVENIGVIEGYNIYSLEGQIPVKQKFTQKFIGIPIQFNFFLVNTDKYKFSSYANLSINLYQGRNDKTWYYYNTPDEFHTDNNFGKSPGVEKTAISYEFGMQIDKSLINKMDLIMGLNFRNLFHEHKFPWIAKKVKYYNIGLLIGLKYYLDSANKKSG